MGLQKIGKNQKRNRIFLQKVAKVAKEKAMAVEFFLTGENNEKIFYGRALRTRRRRQRRIF